MAPFISILLPTKNPGHFLQERLDSIFAQSVTDWELIIADSHSTDGSQEIFRELVKKDPRVSLYELPPGLYQAWNFAIRQARGKYIYIATADDTMRADALEKMSRGLEAHPECGLCDSRLKLIDENGDEIKEFAGNYIACRWHFAFPEEQKHIRRKYSDFFAHLGGKTIYTSMTQLLIRRALFEKTGLFPEDYGPSADYMWGMRAALHSDVLFLPEYLSSWRIHSEQATFASDTEKINKNFFLMKQMAEKVLHETPAEIAAVGRRINRLALFKGLLLPAKKNKYSFAQKLSLLGRAFLHTPLLTLEFLFTLPAYQWRIPRNFIFIYTYDKMIYRHTKRFYQGKIEICDNSAERGNK